MRYFLFAIFILLSTNLNAQFRLVGVGEWSTINDSTYSATVTFYGDQTGMKYLAKNISDTMRVFTGTEQLYQVTAVGVTTFQSAELIIIELNGDHGPPDGQVMVFDPDGKETIPQAPFGSKGSTAQIQAAIDSYNVRLIGTGGVDLSPYSTTVETRQEISDSISTLVSQAQLSDSTAAIRSDISGQEQVEDWVGGMVSDGSGINTYYSDSSGILDISVDSSIISTVSAVGDTATILRSLISSARVSDGDKGDIIATANGAVWTIDTSAVDSVKIATNAVGSDEIASSGVVAGSYSAADVTIDEDGRVTSASSSTTLIPVADHTEILDHAAPLGAKFITNDGVIYRNQSASINSITPDSLFIIPTQLGYAIQLDLINNGELFISKGMIIENSGGYANNNEVLEKASVIIEDAATIGATSITLRLPEANIYIDDTWDIRGSYPSYSFYIEGAGNTNNGTSGTTILYQGTRDTAVLIRDSHHSIIRDINFTATTDPKFTVFLDTFISTVQFQNVTFRCYGEGCQSLLELNRLTPNQISEIYVNNCLFQGDSATDNDSIGTHNVETGISGGYLNNEILHVSESQFLNLDTAIMYNGPGPMTVDKCNFANNWMDIWGGIGNNTITNNYSEHVKRFYGCSRYSGIVHSFLMNNDIAGSQPQEVYQGVIVKGAGYGTLINNKFGILTSDTTFRIQWDLTADKDIQESHYQTADGLFAINNYFCQTSNEPGNRWLVDWSFNEVPLNGTWGKQVKAWNNRGGSNDNDGIGLYDHWDTYITYAESDTNIVARVNQLMPINVSSGAVTVTPPGNAMPNQWFAISDSRGNANNFNIIVNFVSAGYNLHGSSQNFTISTQNDYQKFLYLNSTIGWIRVN